MVFILFSNAAQPADDSEPAGLKVTQNSFQHFLLGHYMHCISVDAPAMVSKNCPRIGEYVGANFVA